LLLQLLSAQSDAGLLCLLPRLVLQLLPLLLLLLLPLLLLLLPLLLLLLLPPLLLDLAQRRVKVQLRERQRCLGRERHGAEGERVEFEQEVQQLASCAALEGEARESVEEAVNELEDRAGAR